MDSNSLHKAPLPMRGKFYNTLKMWRSRQAIIQYQLYFRAMTISEANELLSPEHRKFCISEFKNLPSLRTRKKQDSNKNNDKTDSRDSAVLVPICRLADGSVSLLYTKRSSVLRFVRVI